MCVIIMPHSSIATEYLDCGAGLKFEGLGLPVLEVHLQYIGQEEQRVPL